MPPQMLLWICTTYFFRQMTVPLSVSSSPPGFAGEGRRSAETAALLGEEAAQQRAGNRREGSSVAVCFLFMFVSRVQERLSILLRLISFLASLSQPSINFLSNLCVTLVSCFAPCSFNHGTKIQSRVFLSPHVATLSLLIYYPCLTLQKTIKTPTV